MGTREEWVDNLKGIAIYLVVLGHCIQYMWYHNVNFDGNFLFQFIYSFHMALFSMVSGYLFYYFAGRYSLVDGLRRKVRAILIPCLAWGGIGYIMAVFLEGEHVGVKSCVWFLLNHNWFLWACFYSSIVSLFCLAIDRSFWKAALTVITISFLVPDILNSIGFKMMFPFFVIGFYLNKRQIVQRFSGWKGSRKLLVLMGGWAVYGLLMALVITPGDIMVWSVFCLNDQGLGGGTMRAEAMVY